MALVGKTIDGTLINGLSLGRVYILTTQLLPLRLSLSISAYISESRRQTAYMASLVMAA